MLNMLRNDRTVMAIGSAYSSAKTWLFEQRQVPRRHDDYERGIFMAFLAWFFYDLFR